MRHLLIGLLAAGGIAAQSGTALGAKCDWRVSGTFKVEHQLPEMEALFGDKQALRNIQVKVSGKTGKALPWGSWGTVRTNANGEFSLTKNKSCKDRYIKIEVKFEDSEIELRHENATSSLTKVKWYEAYNSANFGNKRAHNTVDFGTLTFGPGAGVNDQHERGLFEAYRHAQLWTVFKLVNDKLEGFGPEYDFERKIIAKYPHNSWLVGEAEASYMNPITKIMYLHKDSARDHFNMATILHETGHAWAYDKFSGEGCLTWDLVTTHDTHDLAPSSCSAFHEGFAEVFRLAFENKYFGESMVAPHNRARLSSGSGLTDAIPRPSLVERLDEGWISVMMAMMDDRLSLLKFGTANDTPGRASSIGMVNPACDEPSVGLKRLLKVFLSDGGAGFPRDLSKEETKIEPFLSRSAAILAAFDEVHADAIVNAHDSRETEQPADFLCSMPVLKPVTRDPGTAAGIQPVRKIGN